MTLLELIAEALSVDIVDVEADIFPEFDTEEVEDGDILGIGDDDALWERRGDHDEDVLGVTLLEIAAEALRVDIDESDAVTLAEEVIAAVSEGDSVTLIERDTAADDDKEAVADGLDVDDKLASMDGETDGDICIDEETKGVELTLSDIKEVLLANDDIDSDTDALKDDDVESEPDDVEVILEDIDVSGDVVVDTDAETVREGRASELAESTDRGEILEVEDVDGD